ncbi:site-specific integrase [Pseudoalteromonas sp. NGC95]|nr:site-specific integrase [Pseudoalteromonas sp. NGC95]
MLKKGGSFDWDANSFLTEYSGGPQMYNVRPIADTVVKKAYSLNIFCNLLEDEKIKLHEINNATLYKYVELLKSRGVFDDTIQKHGRTALEYIQHLNKIYPLLNLATTEPDSLRKFNVHIEIKKYKNGSIEKKYLHHDSLNGLIHIASEPEYVRDHELIMWLDAINCTTYHPTLDNFLISRWEAFTTLLEITGSRISEVHQVTRTMIKEAASSLFENEKMPIIRNIPIKKGKYKGHKRSVQTTSEDIQVILLHISAIEKKFTKMDHDSIFVDSNTGTQLKPSYLKNYAKKVINHSKYKNALSHLSNHSFRHRFITLHIAKAIKQLSSSGSFSNILNIAATACRKVTMHASNSTLSHYVHLASEYNIKNEIISSELINASTQIRIRIKKMLMTSKLLNSKKINETEALASLLSTLNEFKKFDSL